MAGRKSRAAIAEEQAAMPLTETPEFKAAVAKAASEAAAQAVGAAMAKIAEHGAPKGAGYDDQATALMRGLAMSIADITDQGIGQTRRVDPRVIEARQQAYSRMDAILSDVATKLAEAKASGDQALRREWLPEWRVIGKIYFNERLVEPFRKEGINIVPNEIYWAGPPCDLLRPINPIAERIYKEYRAWVGQPERVKGTDNRPVWITQRGLVVKGDPPPRATVAPTVDFRDEFSVKMGDDPNASEINVLGTVAAPARVNQAERDRLTQGAL